MAVFDVRFPGLDTPVTVEAANEKEALAKAKAQIAPSTWESLGQGAKDLYQGPAQLLDQTAAWGMGKLGPEGQQNVMDAYRWVGQALAGRDYAPGQLAEEIRKDAAKYEARRGPGAGVDWLRLAPGVLASLTPAGAARIAATRAGSRAVPQGLFGRTTGGAVTGAATGAGLTPSAEKDYWRDVQERAIGGAIGGGLGNAVLGGLTNLHLRSRAPRVDAMMDAGIQPTFGGAVGGGFQRIEDAMQIQPLIGAKIRDRKDEFVHGYNLAELNRALAPIKKSVDEPGKMSFKQAQKYADEAQEDAKGLIGRVPFDTQARQEIYDLGQRMPGETAETADALQRWYLNNFERRLAPQRPAYQRTGVIDPNATIGAEDFKKIISDLWRRQQANKANEAGIHFKDMRDILREAAGRHSPEYGAAATAADTNWARMARLEEAQNASNLRGAASERFLPRDVRNAVTKPNIALSARRGSGTRTSAAGEAAGQEFASQAEKTLGKYYEPGQSVPMSQAALMSLLPHLVAAGSVGAATGDTGSGAMAALIPYLVGTPFYSKFGQRAAVKAIRSPVLNMPRYSGGVLGGALGGQLADR